MRTGKHTQKEDEEMGKVPLENSSVDIYYALWEDPTILVLAALLAILSYSSAWSRSRSALWEWR